MKAMVFAAGVGSRLKELTAARPKCLMEAGGKTLLAHVLLRLKECGVTDIMINVHHFHQMVIDYVTSMNGFGVRIDFSYEPVLLDTGGGLKKVFDFFQGEECFLIHNSDIYCDAPLNQIVEAHLARKRVGTLAVMERPSTRGLYFDNDLILNGWTSETDRSPPEGSKLLAFSGISAASSEIFKFMGPETHFSLIAPYLTASRALGAVCGHRIDNYMWTDIGTPEALKGLQDALRHTMGN